MFTEILRIKPVLDKGTAAQMENNLSSRFRRITMRFGQGLRMAIKGSILGITIGLLARLLNPLEKMEEKIKNLLALGKDTSELADEFGTTPGKLRQLQDVAGSIGVSPEQLKDMMTKYASAIEKAREELSDPTAQISGSTQAVRNFVDEKDTAEGFLKFLQSLKARGEGTGSDVFFGEKEQRKAMERAAKGEVLTESERARLTEQGLLKRRSGLETRQAIEKEVFGEAQKGSSRRLIEADFPTEFRKAGAPSESQLNESFQKVNQLADKDRQLRIQRDTQDFINQSKAVNQKMIQDMADAEKARLDRETREFQSYDDLKRAATGIEDLKVGFEKIQQLLARALGYLGDTVDFLMNFKNSRLYRMFGGGGN